MSATVLRSRDSIRASTSSDPPVDAGAERPGHGRLAGGHEPHQEHLVGPHAAQCSKRRTALHSGAEGVEGREESRIGDVHRAGALDPASARSRRPEPPRRTPSPAGGRRPRQPFRPPEGHRARPGNRPGVPPPALRGRAGRSRTRLMRSLSLWRSSAAPLTSTAGPWAARAPMTGSSSMRPGTSAAPIATSRSAPDRMRMQPNGSPPEMSVVDRASTSAPGTTVQHVEKRGACRVQADRFDGHVRVRERGGGHGPEGGGGGVPRHRQGQGAECGAAGDGDGAAGARDSGTPNAGERPLGVVPRRRTLA